MQKQKYLFLNLRRSNVVGGLMGLIAITLLAGNIGQHFSLQTIVHLGGKTTLTAPPVASNNKRWAVMMIGAGRTYAFTRESFKQNVVNQANPPMDVFVSTHENASCSVDGLSAVLLEMDSTAWRYEELSSGLNPQEQTVDRFQREQTELLQLIDDYAKGGNITYDYILQTRPDLLYTVPINVKKLETKFDESVNGTIFIPKCCDFFGWCDRLAAAKYGDYSSMISSSKQWLATGDNSIHEVAFKNRALFANLTRFDMHKFENMTEDYGFVTARLGAAVQHCEERTIESFFTDTVCNNCSPFSFNETSGMCKFLNKSLARNERCRMSA